MAEFSPINTETRAKETVLERQYNIARQEASREAVKQQVHQQQLNENLISASKAELEATKLKAEAKVMEAQAEARSQDMLLEIAKKRAEMYDRYPGQLNYDLSANTVKAMKGIKTTIISLLHARKDGMVFYSQI